MEDNINKENYLKEKFIFFIKKNKKKNNLFFYSSFNNFWALYSFLNLNKKKQQILISEKIHTIRNFSFTKKK